MRIVAIPISLLVAALLCCAAPDLSVRPLGTPIATPPPEIQDAGHSTEAVALPPKVPPLEPLTCRWDADTYEPEKPLPLSTTWDTHQPFATLTRATKLDFTFSETNVDVLGVSFVAVGGAYSMKAIVPTSSVSFFPKKARVVDGYLVPSPALPFTKPRLEPAVKLAVIDLACPGVEPAAALVTEWPCDEIAITPNRYELDAMLPRERVRDAGLTRARAIPLATAPKGTVVATLKPDRAANVVVTETSGAESRIVWRTPQCAVFGWVATKDLVAATKPPKARPTPKPTTATPAPATPPAEQAVETRTCKGAVPFAARGTLIGQLFPDRPIDIAEHQQDGWSRLVLPSAAPLEETYFVARTSDLELCAKKGSP